jgi:hypothetical protein
MLTIDNLKREAQVAATISAYFALGSIVVGAFSIWRHQASTRTSEAVSVIIFSTDPPETPLIDFSSRICGMLRIVLSDYMGML